MKKNKNKPIVLAILDGWGIGPKNKKVNAIEAAKTPFFDQLIKNFPNTQLGATGKDVGLEQNQMSGSEAGHLNIGAGRIVQQDVLKILTSIVTGAFFKNPVLLGALRHAQRYDSKIHLVGMLGNDDSPHSHPDILLALHSFFKQYDLTDKTFLHLFTDGRDSYPKSALEHWSRWKDHTKGEPSAKLATLCGRFYAMDRTKNWERLNKAFDLLVHGKGEKYPSFEKALEANYQKGNTDEYLDPSVIETEGGPTATIGDNDVVLFFNFRSDRTRQFTKFFVGTNTQVENNFPEVKKFENLFCVAMTHLGPDLNIKTAFETSPLTSTLPVAMSEKNQLYIAETEKYAHVTYFINGGYADAVGGEKRVIIDSPKVKSYAQMPEMSAEKVTNVIESGIRHELYDITVVNYANTDIVAHSGNFSATVRAAEFVDLQIKRLYKEIEKKGGSLIITADHGNADLMIDEKANRPYTFHTKNPVPFVLASPQQQIQKIKFHPGGVLGNIAPTVLELLELQKPYEMECSSLIVRK